MKPSTALLCLAVASWPQSSTASSEVAMDALAIVEHVAPARALLAHAASLELRDGGWTARRSSLWVPLTPAPTVGLPVGARGVLHLAAPANAAASLDVRALDVAEVPATATARALVMPSIAHDLDSVHWVTARGAEELRILRSDLAPTKFRYRLELGEALVAVRVVAGRVQVLDRSDQVEFESPAPRAWDADGAPIDLEVAVEHVAPRSWVLTVSAHPGAARYPVVVDPTWEYVGPVPAWSVFSGQRPSANVLPDGKVLIAGGYGYDETISEVVHSDSLLFDPKTGALTKGPDMPGRRWDHAAVNAGTAGIVLAGGNAAGLLSTASYLSTVILYKPATKSFTTLPPLQRARQGATAVAMADGRVLVVGGTNSSALTVVDIVDATAGTTTKAAPFSDSRIRPGALLLRDGRVLIVGGGSVELELFDPAAGTWSKGPKSAKYLDEVGLHMLPSGKVLIVPMDGLAVAATWIYDPAASTLGDGPPMKTVHARGASASLADGRVLVTGGEKGINDLREAEIFDEAKGAWTQLEPMDVPRNGHQLLPLADGRVFIVHATPGILNVPLGGKCDRDAVCASGTCADGRCCATACDRRCAACDLPGTEGTCSPLTGKQRDGHASCAPYAMCNAGTCVTKCASDTDCAAGSVCYSSGTCAPPRATCDGDHSVTDKDTGRKVDCAPYKCTTAGDCKKICESSNDCAPGAACQDGHCLSGATAADSGGGCALGATGSAPAGGAFGLVAAAILAARRRTRASLIGAAVAALSAACSAEAPAVPAPSGTGGEGDGPAPAARLAVLAGFPRIAEVAAGRAAPFREPYATLTVTLPRAPGEPLVVARADRPAASLEIAPEGDAPATIAHSQGWAVMPASRAATDVFVAATADRVEEIRVLSSASAPTTTVYRVKLGTALATMRVRDGRFEALDPAGRVLLASEPVWAQDRTGVVRGGTLTANADGPGRARLTVAFDTAGLVYPIALDPAWRATGQHQGSMANGAAVQLESGNVVTLTKPGSTGGAPAAELYDAATGEWKVAGTPALPRDFAATARISPTRALFAGGGSYAGSVLTPLRTVEIYDETTNSWKDGAAMTTARASASLLPLPGNKLLLFEGNIGAGRATTAEIYDIATDTWTAGPPPTKGHYGMALALPDGRVLALDGKNSEAFDPAKLSWAPIALPPLAINNAIVLGDGRVLAAGEKKAAAIYDPKADKWTDAGPVNVQQSYYSGLARLKSGRVLMAGGEDDAYHSVSSAELFDPLTNKWTDLQPMPQTRYGHFMFTLPTGSVLVFGGSNDATFEALKPILFRVENGLACAKDDECLTGFCTDGVCCDTRCRGACDVCDRPTAKGICGPSDAPPRDGHGSCEPFAKCAAGKCIDKCGEDGDCAGGVCFKPTGKCGDKGATCDGNHTITLAAGGTKDCAPYTCAPTGDCNTRCASSADCVSGSACDEGFCVTPAAAADAASGGCTTSGPTAPFAGSIGVAALLGLARRRRR